MDKLANRAAAVISISSAASLIFAIIYEIGYFSSIHFSLMKLMSLSDYFQSAIVSLPFALLANIAAIYWNIGNVVYEKNLLEHVKEGKSKRAHILFARHSSALMFYLFFFAGCFLALFSERPEANIYMAFMMMGIMLFCVQFWLSISSTLDEVPEKYKDVVRPSIMVGATVLLVICLYGFANGVMDTMKKKSNLAATMQSRQPVILLRSLSQGNLVMRTRDRQILAINNNGKVLLSYQLPISSRSSHFCNWTGYMCKFMRRHPVTDTAP